MTGTVKKLLTLGGFSLAAVLATHTYASGYRMEFQSASVLADSGEAAVVEDAGTNWYNAAGLVYLPQQMVFTGFDVYAPTTFAGTMNAPSNVLPGFGFDFLANGNASSHPNSLIPAFHYALPLNQQWSFGFSFTPAWGFTEDYGANSLVRYDLTRVYTKTIDLSPSLAARLNDQWSIGFGPDLHYFSVSSRNKVRTQPLTVNDSVARFSASDWGWGAHMGVLWRMSDATRLGVNYRTKIVMDMDGYSSFQLMGITAFETNRFSLRIPLPPSTTVSLYHDVTPNWALMGTVAYDQWSVLRAYYATNVQQPSGLVNVTLPQKMSNTFDFGIGTHYQFNPQWMLRANIKYLSTPTDSQFRDINFPDGNKLGIQIGGRYQMNQKLAFDFLYGHVFVKTVAINGFNPVTGALLTGHSRTSIDLIGGQVVWNI